MPTFEATLPRYGLFYGDKTVWHYGAFSEAELGDLFSLPAANSETQTKVQAIYFENFGSVPLAQVLDFMDQWPSVTHIGLRNVLSVSEDVFEYADVGDSNVQIACEKCPRNVIEAVGKIARVLG